MSLNKQGPGKIDWCDFTSNPISGCLHECDYCYLKRNSRISMEPKFHPERLKDFKRKKPAKIFVGSAADMWGEWVNPQWIEAVLDTCILAPQHTFQFLTKNPRRYAEFALPKKCWYGTTVDGTQRTERNCEILSVALYNRIGPQFHSLIKFISFEPLLAPIIGNLRHIDWIIIGANSNRGAPKPADVWADTLIEIARENDCAVWMKDNYQYHTRIKEFPVALSLNP